MFDCFPATVHSLIRANCCNLARLGDVTLVISIISRKGVVSSVFSHSLNLDFDIIQFCCCFSRAARNILVVSCRLYQLARAAIRQNHRLMGGFLMPSGPVWGLSL